MTKAIEEDGNTNSTNQSPSRHPSTVLNPTVLIELRHTFDGDLAQLAYVPFCRLAGKCSVFVGDTFFTTCFPIC